MVETAETRTDMSEDSNYKYDSNGNQIEVAITITNITPAPAETVEEKEGFSIMEKITYKKLYFITLIMYSIITIITSPQWWIATVLILTIGINIMCMKNTKMFFKILWYITPYVFLIINVMIEIRLKTMFDKGSIILIGSVLMAFSSWKVIRNGDIYDNYFSKTTYILIMVIVLALCVLTFFGVINIPPLMYAMLLQYGYDLAICDEKTKAGKKRYWRKEKVLSK